MRSVGHPLKYDTLIYGITAAYFLWLVVILVIFGYTPTNDGDGYIEYAMLCLEAGEPYPNTEIINTTSFIWNIGAINLIELSIVLFGSWRPVLLLMCVMKALTALLTARTAERLFGRRVAMIALLVFVLYPNNWGQTTTLLSEVPAIFLLVAVVYLMLTAKRKSVLIIAGVLLFGSNYFRSIAIVIIVTFAGYYLLFDRGALLRRLVPMLAGYVLALCVVGAECYRRTGYFIYQGNALWYNVGFDAYDGADIAPYYGTDHYAKGTPLYIENMEAYNCFERNEIWKGRCMAWICGHKAEWIGKIPKRIMYMYYNDIDNMSFCLRDKSDATKNNITLPYRTLNKEIGRLTGAQYAALVCSLCYYIILAAFLIGTLSMVRRKEWRQLALLLMIIVIGTMSVVTVIHGESRYKEPYMPYIMIVASAGMSCLVDKMKSARSRRAGRKPAAIR